MTHSLVGRRLPHVVLRSTEGSDGVIEKVFYPVVPPEDNAAEVLAYLTHEYRLP